MCIISDSAGDKPFDFTTLFHTYFKVPDVTQTTVSGLEDLTYIDKVHGCLGYYIKDLSQNDVHDGKLDCNLKMQLHISVIVIFKSLSVIKCVLSILELNCLEFLTRKRGGGTRDESLRESAGEAIWRWKENIDNLASGAHVVHTTAKQREWLLYLQR